MQNRFKQLLEEKNLTANRFAALIKVNASAMSHILNGHRKPGFDVLGKIAQAFPDVNLNWLISGEGPAYNQMADEKPNQDLPLPQFVNTTNSSKKRIKRIILFFEDGSFEDYVN
ncbi:helix-turn-helix transcriptional regulator [Bacteroides acidifaciens]|uniref:helix-turn-helix domain-containing protein n=1 Tax=Bacteroides acidifaciens TaxID=85831 RepID=UPI002557C7B7|nr:helix-turn-helix transcriptional regulator [Bacteroides acidifaciens]